MQRHGTKNYITTTLFYANLIAHRSFYRNKDPDKLRINNYTNTILSDERFYEIGYACTV